VTSSDDANKAKGLRTTVGSNGCSGTPSPDVASMCSLLDGDVKAENRNAGLSTGMYVAGGALAAAAVVTWFAWPESDKKAEAALRLSPILGPGVAGLMAGGEF
jgi:hypothetical protein